jgi:hypothetical protein
MKIALPSPTISVEARFRSNGSGLVLALGRGVGDCSPTFRILNGAQGCGERGDEGSTGMMVLHS